MSKKSVIFAKNNYLFFIAMNPLYKDIRGKVITDFYSEYDLQMLGFSLEEFSIPKYSDYEKACSLYNAAQTIEDSDLMEAAEKLILGMQEQGYGQEQLSFLS